MRQLHEVEGAAAELVAPLVAVRILIHPEGVVIRGLIIIEGFFGG